MNSRSTIGGILVVVSLLVLAAAAYLVWGTGRPAPAPAPATPAPGAVATPLPSFTPYVPATLTPPQEAGLRVTCNAYANLSLIDARTGAGVAQGNCSAQRAPAWTGLHPGSYVLRYDSPDLGYQDERSIELVPGENEKEVLLPGILEIEPVPADATVEVDGEAYQGTARLVYPAVQCPFTATVYVYAAGYQDDGRLLPVEAGVRHVYVMALQPLPTPIPPPWTAGPTRPPVTSVPVTPPWTVEERVALVRQKLYESANCTRAENGMGPLPYVSEWQDLADEMARAWRDYYLANGPNGFDASPWRQQFQAAGGDAVHETAGLDLYAPDYYVYLGPGSRWETFDMCDPDCPAYGMFRIRTDNLLQANGVVIGLAPWWDGDVLNAALVLGIKW